MDSTNANGNEHFPYIYPPSNFYGGDVTSVASYEEILTLPRKLPGKENSYVSFGLEESLKCYNDDALSKDHNHCQSPSCKVPKSLLIVLSVFLMLLCVILILQSAGIVQIKSPWKTTTIPSVIPYESEDWFVCTSQWGTDLHYTDCPTFKLVNKVTVTQIIIDDFECEEIKSCEKYLAEYDYNVTVLQNGELEYEFFFGDDKHVFEGRNWNCFYEPGTLRLGYLGNKYDPQDPGDAWKHIRYTIIEFGIKNSLVDPNVCYDVDPSNLSCT